MTIFVKKNQKIFFPGLGNERGSAIVIALIVLIALTVMGVTSSNISITELVITGNDVVSKISFMNSDAGIYAVPKVISKAINDKATPVSMSPPFTFVDVGTDTTPGDRTFFTELSGFVGHDDAADIIFMNDGIHTTEVDVDRLGGHTPPGGGAEFGSGSEGRGTSMKALQFMMSSTGKAQKKAVTQIESRYLKILGVAGGL